MIGFLLITAVSIVSLGAVLGVVVTIHELGHFMAGKMFGVAMDRFSIGFGKALWSRTDRDGVEWRIGAIPLGGYVRFSGDSNDASIPDSEDLDAMRQRIAERLGPEAVSHFHPFKPLWQRAVIAAAGPFANFVLAVAGFTCILLAVGEDVAKPIVNAVAPGSRAEQAGFKAGDLITAINGRHVQYFGDVERVVSVRPGEPIAFDLLRDGTTVHLTAVPARVIEKDKSTGLTYPVGRIGLMATGVYHRRFTPPQAVARGVSMTVERVTSTLTYLRRIVTRQESGDQISGVIGMGYVAGKAVTSAAADSPNPELKLASVGLTFLNMLAIISVGVGFVNLLPIPILDGGHLVFYAYEAVARRPAGPRLQAASLKVGVALVLCLMLFAGYNDLHRMQVFKFLGDLFS